MINPRGTYDLPLTTPPELGLDAQIKDLCEFESYLRALGIEVRNTRIDRYTQYLKHLQTDEAADPLKVFNNVEDTRFRSPIDWYLYVLREVHELMWILAGLKKRTPLGIDQKLKVVVGGRDFAALDADSTSRNAQFELRIASYFCQAGCEVDLSSDTDVVAKTDTDAYFVECKRVASRKQLSKRAAQAKRQLKRRLPRKDGKRRVLGCVALDVTKVAFTHNGLTWGLTPDHTRDIIQEGLVRVASDFSNAFEFEGCRKLLGYWLQIHIPALVMKPPAPLTRFSSYHIARSSLGRKERKALKEFYDLFERVSVVDARAQAPRPLKLRQAITLPAGTVFHLNRDRLLHLRRSPHRYQEAEAEVIGSLEIEGESHEFTVFEFATLPPEVVDAWSAHHGTEEVEIKSDLDLLAALFLQRYPYEDRSDPLGTACEADLRKSGRESGEGPGDGSASAN